MIDLKFNSSADLKKEGKSFYWASFFLPKMSKKNAGILYSICRYFDDIADKNSEDKTTYLKKSINEIKNNQNNKVNLFLQKNKINNLIFIDLIEGLILDQRQIRIQNEEELIKYSYHVAGTVGLMMSKIIGVKHEKAAQSAIDLGIAMQLTNIARDVVEDSSRNRKYIDHDFIKIKETLGVAELFYKSSFKSIKEIPLVNRFAILVARRVYREIGNNILRKKNLENYNKSGKIFVNKIGKIKQTILSIFDLFLLIFSKSDIHLTNEEHMEIGKEINLNERF